MTSARVIADSISPDGVRLTTLEVVMHRFVLAEFNTHRAFSRNSASSRAIPVERTIHAFTTRPAWPLEWPAEQPGMQGGEHLKGDDLYDARRLLEDIHNYTTAAIQTYLQRHPDKATRLHKSVINRTMEWAQWHTVLVTSTEWDNFFQQRRSRLAQPEIMAAADAMYQALEGSEPTLVNYGEWHTPLIQPDELPDFQGKTGLEVRLHVSTARCARVSYLTHDGKRDRLEDVKLYDRLMGAGPRHWSPLEHVATPAASYDVVTGNFDMWAQLRHSPRWW